MITDDENVQSTLADIDYGLSVTFDGKRYTVLQSGIVQDYPIGGLITEYIRLRPTEIKSIILDCPHLEKKYSKKYAVKTIIAFYRKLLEAFPPATAFTIFMDFNNGFIDWTTAISENRVSELLECYPNCENDKVKDFIFADTPYNSFGCDTNLQLMLTLYYSFSESFSLVKYVFNQILNVNPSDPEKQKQIFDAYCQMYNKYIDMQHIDFRVLALDNGLHNLYTIKTALSLFLFEMANAQNADTSFLVCPNCQNVFVRDGRSDIIYCSYPSPQNPKKTCREIGAQIARSNKEKNDVATREYRKVYMRLSQQARRNVGNRAKKEPFTRLTAENVEWKSKLSEGSATVEEYLEWLNSFKN